MTEKKIKVLFMLPSLLYTGAERQVVDLINGLSEDLFISHLLVLGDELDQLECLNRKKVTFYHCPRKHKYDFSPRKNIESIIDTENIDIIHCTNQIPILYGFLGKIKAKKKVKFIGALHTTINRNLKNEMFDWFLYAPLMNFCDAIITVCDNQKIHWSRKYPYLARKFVTIHNGIDMEKYRVTLSDEEKLDLRRSLDIQDEDFTAGIMAEFRPEKGHEYAFKALKSLVDGGKKIKLLLIGDGERKDCLRSLSGELSIANNILWLGYQKDPRPYLSICDVLLVPSFAETFSMTILESLSMGKPVVATDVGGTSEIVVDGVNGFLVRPKDDDSLADKLQKCVKDENLRRKLSDNARDTVVNKFSASEMISKTESLFTKISVAE